MIRLANYPVQEKITDDVDWKNVPRESWQMNFRPLRRPEQEHVEFRRITISASMMAAVALVSISVLNALCPFVFGNSETVLLLAFAAAVPFFFAWQAPRRESGIRLYGMLVLLLAISNLGLLFMGNYRDEFYSTIFVAVVVPFTLYVLDKVATHFVHRATASPSLDRDAMLLLRNVWKERFKRGLFVPAQLRLKNREGEADDITASLRIVANYPAYLLAVLFLCLASIFGVQVFATSFVAQAGLLTSCLLLFATAAWIGYRREGCADTTLSAIKLFCTAWTFPLHMGTIQYPFKYQTRLNWFYSAITVLSFAVNTFWFPWAVESFTHLGSATHLILNIAIQFAVVVALAPLLLFAMALIAIGPVLREFERLCEGDKALMGRKGWSEFDAYHDRLRRSGNATEAECIWVGFHQQREFPILIPESLFNQHAHLLGGTGAGKTGLGLATLAAQIIKNDKGPVIIIDGKGDNEFFQSVRGWSEEQGRTFKWFTTSAEKSTYLFNPLGQKAIERFSLSDIVGFLLQSFNLFHGSGYGKGWFTQASKSALTEAAKLKRAGEPRPPTLELFSKHLQVVIAKNEGLEKAAQHVKFMLETLSEFPQLNDGFGDRKTPHPACEHAIEMMDVIENNQVVYFSFESLTDPSSAGELSRMAVYSAIAAAKAYKDKNGKAADVTIIIDEAQNVVAANIGAAIEQARSAGIMFVFAHQSRDQLKIDSNTDLRSVFDLCTQVKMYFDAQGESVKHLEEMSREVSYADPTWQQFVSDVQAGNASMNYAIMKNGNPALADVRQHIGRRLTVNEIQNVSADDNLCIFACNRKRGLAQFNGPFPIHINYPVTKDDYADNKRRRWPVGDEKTTSSLPHWPKVVEETMIRKETESSKSNDETVLEQLQAAAEEAEKNSSTNF